MSRKRNYGGDKSLVLNADYSCINLMPMRNGLENYVKHMLTGNTGLRAADFYNRKVLTCGGDHIQIPSVLITLEYIRPKGKRVPFSRKNVFMRDNMTCMYCGHYDSSGKTLTYDHVIPRAIWKRQNHTRTPTDWKNIVTACAKCNTKKANRTPDQAGMKLRMEPFEPNPHNHVIGFSPWMKIHPTWEPYFPKIYKNLLEKQQQGV